jgi:cytochrome c peroxidase
MAKPALHKTIFITVFLLLLVTLTNLSFKSPANPENENYRQLYHTRLNDLVKEEHELADMISSSDLKSEVSLTKILEKIYQARSKLKAIDLWLRYLEPTSYLKINGPLPVEWENEVFEKWEAPYKREGAGLILAELYLEEKDVAKDSLLSLIHASIAETAVYKADSITRNLNRPDHFFFANRLYLLNLSAIYTTGFECPDVEKIIPELLAMMTATKDIYTSFNASFPASAISKRYAQLYDSAITYVRHQPMVAENFDHYSFTRNYVNPLFALNQEMIRNYRAISNNFNDFTLNDQANSIFDKTLFEGQNTKGIFLPVDDPAALEEIKKTGKVLFYDPILSGNNKRSCASCHKSTEYFTDTTKTTSFQFDNQQTLPRNTPSLINVLYNHLVMMDGKHISLLNQAKDVVTNSTEMGGVEDDVVSKVMSCKEYEQAFKKYAKLTPNSKKVKIDHIVSAVILYYSDFSKYYSPFDDAMNEQKQISAESRKGFNVFMSKAQCGTCHFIPNFNGVKPPYVNSEFEVLGVPFDTTYKSISPDSGRAMINPAKETMHAFRTGTIRNTPHTPPYMHNGIFKTLDEVIDFYDAGGGVGKGLKISNQTLPSDSLKLTVEEKKQLLAFIKSLDEKITFDTPPARLPGSKNKALNKRAVGGEF